MKRILLAIISALVLAPSLLAQNAPVVVELYTSQGCSSCPPADAMLHELAEREDVIALALHVDYWDYIGWKDAFSNPAHTKRQREYAAVAGRRSVYTPQMIINGTTDIVGARADEVDAAIRAHRAAPPRVAMTLTRNGNTLAIGAKVTDTSPGPMIVQMLRYQPIRSIKITRGENAGHTYDYANVAQDWQLLGRWDGSRPLAIEANIRGNEPTVVLIQGAQIGPIFAAARVD